VNSQELLAQRQLDHLGKLAELQTREAELKIKKAEAELQEQEYKTELARVQLEYTKRVIADNMMKPSGLMQS
jgi:hypothetical protein